MNRKYLALSLATLLLSFLPALAVVTKYDTDTAHSNIGFSIPILGGLSRVGGKFSDFTASIVYDDADVTKSSVNVVIKTASIDTGIERRDAHLRTPDFFDAEKFPEITFQSKHIEKKGNQFVAHGTFTMHGVSKEIALPFTINGVKKDEKSGKTTLGVSARSVIKKSDYGMTWSRPDNPNFLGDEVEISLDLVTRAAGPQQPAAATTAAPSGR
jgi:polyisoprenoid-binding protein YceI